MTAKETKDIFDLDEETLNKIPWHIDFIELENDEHCIKLTPCIAFKSEEQSTEKLRGFLGLPNDAKDTDFDSLINEKCNYSFVEKENNLYLELRLKNDVNNEKGVLTYLLHDNNKLEQNLKFDNLMSEEERKEFKELLAKQEQEEAAAKKNEKKKVKILLNDDDSNQREFERLLQLHKENTKLIEEMEGKNELSESTLRELQIKQNQVLKDLQLLNEMAAANEDN